MSSDSDNELVHDELLEEIRELDKPSSVPKKSKRLKLKKTETKIDLNELLGTIKSTK